MEIVQNSEGILIKIVQNFEEIINKKDICKEENEIENKILIIRQKLFILLRFAHKIEFIILGKLKVVK